MYLRSFTHSVSPAVVTISDVDGKLLHPVSLLCSYMDSVGRRRATPLFELTLKVFGLALDRVCSAAVAMSRITPHCFRHGGAIWSGWAGSRIKAHGRWWSRV